ncbi:hypothetical protein DRW41_12660 [Neobacillus piezotolerans]|uniref:Uncharacterized protein n=1 Tax=Neobacillus piezotolerans TaxID=2259171 RepID=A0A3D8GPG9_9BACI|nr:hypothetical protein [Neobacillus piezotolerans]RDU36383.1 hypothetical protein DRW41_12660 [Neobacillus piezotolerans]
MEGLVEQKELLLQKLSEISDGLERLDAAIEMAYSGLTNELASQKQKEMNGIEAKLSNIEERAQKRGASEYPLLRLDLTYSGR